MSAIPGITLARILELGVPIAWQEAVEVVTAAARLSDEDSVALSLESCTVLTTGSVQLSRGPSGASRMSPRQLLRALLIEAAAPAELRALADGGPPAGEGPGGSPEALDLSWFTRAHPEGEIARLATRALAAEADAHARTEITKLRADAGAAGPAPAPPKPPRGRTWRVAAAVALAASGVAIAGLLVPAEVVHLPATGVAGWWASIAVAPTEAIPAALPPDSTSAPGRPARQALVLARAPESRPTSPLVQPATAESPFAEGGLSPGLAERDPSPAGPEPEPLPGDGSLYSSLDQDVIPPALVYPRLPTPAPDEEPAATVALVLAVDATGRVTRARLDGGGDASVGDRMLVSAAKAWQFQPATRGGRAVPYLLRLPVTR